MRGKITGQTEESAEILRRALSHCARCHGDNHPETALIASNLGAVLSECGDLLGAAQANLDELNAPAEAE